MSDNISKTEFEESSGNIFADLGLENAEELYIRGKLGIQVFLIIKDRGYSQQQAGDILGIKQPEVSALMCNRYQRFSQERLIGFLNKLDRKVMIQVSRHSEGEPYQQVAFG